jgi:large subunit ribosomal protein L13Ae
MVSSSGECATRITVDACHHILDRLSSIIAKELLNDQKVVIVYYQEICLSAGLARQQVF